jgi:hypothetical protein
MPIQAAHSRFHPIMRNEMNKLVDRFLSWPLPDSVCADLVATKQGEPHRSGTNLLSAIEAKQMLEHVIGAELESLRQQDILRDLEIVRLREALDRSRIAIDDWLHLYASEMCDEARVEEAKKRTNENGTLYYIATVQRAVRDTLSTPIDLSALAMHDEEIVEKWKRDAEGKKY